MKYPGYVQIQSKLDGFPTLTDACFMPIKHSLLGKLIMPEVMRIACGIIERLAWRCGIDVELK